MEYKRITCPHDKTPDDSCGECGRVGIAEMIAGNCNLRQSKMDLLIKYYGAGRVNFWLSEYGFDSHFIQGRIEKARMRGVPLAHNE